MDTDITELDELGAEKVSGVGAPANATPWLLLKGTDVAATTETPDAKSPEADEAEEEMTKAEADEIEALLTKARFAGYCETPECDVCKERFGPLHPQLLEKSALRKKKLKAADRKALPRNAFAIPEKAPDSGSYPIHDLAHARNALARSSGKPEASRVRAAVESKYPQLRSDPKGKSKKGKVEKSPGVPDFSVQTPKDNGRLESGKSGAGPVMAPEVRQDHNDPSFSLGGENSYTSPTEELILTPNASIPPAMDRPGVSALTKGWEIEVVDKANWIADDGMSDDDDEAEAKVKAKKADDEVGGKAWQDMDAASCDSVARGLAEAMRAVDAIRARELTEAVSGDASEWFDAWQLSCASDDIGQALALVASLAYREQASADSQDHMSETTKKSIASIQTLLARIAGAHSTQADNGSTTSKEDNNMATITKEDLDAYIAEASTTAATTAAKAVLKNQAKAARKAKAKVQKAKKKAKQKAALAFMEKNANNGGDITEGEMSGKVKGKTDADNIGVVGGKTKKGKATKSDKVMAEALTLLQKMASTPRTGGPVLDGQPRGAFPASEGRTSDTVTKGAAEGDIERLSKSLESATDPIQRDQISRELTLARLRQGHEQGLI